jgi:hypothetical protein
MRSVLFLLQALVVLSSLLAGAFWMSAATGRRIAPFSWQDSQPVPLAGIRDHQAKWNAWAAFSASVAAIAQAVLFFIEYYVLHPLVQ